MNEFNALRTKARERRDKIVADATREYFETLTKIATLEQDLIGRRSSSYMTVGQCVLKVLPTDRTFTTADIRALLLGLDALRDWGTRSINDAVTKLYNRGKIRRLRRSRPGEPAVYAAEGVELPAQPSMTLQEAIATALESRPLNETELCVALLEQGYDSGMNKVALRRVIAAELRAGPFERVGRKWGYAGITAQIARK
jgi:hypothetical protein